jgi:asparagine synthetase B (glutamine-hydrolysing)
MAVKLGYREASAWLYYGINPISISESQTRCFDRDITFREFHCGRLPTLLRNFDYCSMRYGVEVRMPFMDYRVVCYGLSLPLESKFRDGRTKAVLRAAMRGIVPDAILDEKRKIGVAAPLKDWFVGGLRQMILDTVNSASFLRSEIWDGKRVRNFAERLCAASDWNQWDAQRIWRVLSTHHIVTSIAHKRSSPCSRAH